MKHNATQTVKFTRLVRWLRSRMPECPVAYETLAVGLLERLWQFTMANAFRGDVGRYADDEIAEGVGWHGDATDLIAALKACGWLDESDAHRLVVHDWHEHAPKHVKANAARAGGFLSERKEPPLRSLPQGSSSKEPPLRSLPPNVTKRNQTERNQTITPPTPSEAKPEPAPDGRSPAARCESNGKATKRALDTPEFHEWYAAYPRRLAPKAAAKAYAGAVRELIQRGRSPPEAHAFLLDAAREFARSEAGRRESQFVPHPATWLNQERYDDDRSEWNRTNHGGRTHAHGPGQLFAGHDALGEV